MTKRKIHLIMVRRMRSGAFRAYWRMYEDDAFNSVPKDYSTKKQARYAAYAVLGYRLEFDLNWDSKKAIQDWLESKK